MGIFGEAPPKVCNKCGKHFPNITPPYTYQYCECGGLLLDCVTWRDYMGQDKFCFDCPERFACLTKDIE